MWLPKVEFFEHCINQGILSGAIIKDANSKTIKIEENKDAFLQFIRNTDRAKLFNLEEPYIFRKIK